MYKTFKQFFILYNILKLNESILLILYVLMVEITQTSKCMLRNVNHFKNNLRFYELFIKVF
jgi:hypothetical protein